MTEQPNRPVESCPECQVGVLQPRTVPYYAALEGEVISIPYFPAWVCDICRHCEYDESALEDLRVILGPAAQLPSTPLRRRRFAAEIISSWSRPDSRKGSK